MEGREDIDSVAFVPQRLLAGVRARSVLAYIREKTTQPPSTASPKMTPSRIYFDLALRQKLQGNFSGASQMALVVKNLPAKAGDTGASRSVPGSGRSPGVRNDNPLQYSCLGNPLDRGAWWATVHRVAKSQTQLKQLSTTTPWKN